MELPVRMLSDVARKLFSAISLILYLSPAAFAQTLTTTADIGSVGAAGSSAYDVPTATYTLQGAGPDIAGTADAFRYTYKTQSGDCQIIARIGSVQNTDAAAKGGVMIRESTAAGSRYAMVSITPGSGAIFSSRSSTNGSTTTVTIPTRAAPQWVKLIRATTNKFTGYVSVDGIAWEFVGTATISMGSSATIGLAVTSRISATLCTGVFDNVTATAGTITDVTAPSAPTGLAVSSFSDVTAILTWAPAIDDVGVSSYEVYRDGILAGTTAGTVQRFVDSGLSGATNYSYTVKALDASTKVSAASSTALVSTDVNALVGGWSHRDVGLVGVAGTADSLSGITIKGSGLGIGGTTDAFHFVYQPLNGNGEIIARVMTIDNTSASAKSGVMIRETLDHNARYAGMFVTPGSGATFLRRTSIGGSSSSTSGGSGTAVPHWMRLVRTGNNFISYRSTNGVSWTVVGSATITMTANVFVGLAVCSNDNAVRCTSLLNGATMSGDSDADGLPDGWETTHFGDLSQIGTTDPDGDGVTTAQELANGTSPSDYYNGTLPTLAVISGNNQGTTPGGLLANPLVVRATKSGTNQNNAPLTCTITQGGGLLNNVPGGGGSTSIEVRTLSNGQASIYFQAPMDDDNLTIVTVTAWSGTQSTSVNLTATSDNLPRTGLSMWLRADRGVTKDANNLVATWADQSGNGRNATQNTTSAKPTWVDGVLNGKPIIRFLGDDSFNLPNFLTTFTEATVILVNRVSTGHFENGLWTIGTGPFNLNLYPRFKGTTVRLDFGSTVDYEFKVPAQSLYNFHALSIVSRPGEWTGRMNDTLWLTTNQNTVSFPTAPRLGRDINNFFRGDMVELILYNRGLSTAELETVHKNLNAKYALWKPPGTPVSVAATALTEAKVSLSWKNSEPTVETSYIVERKTGAGGSYQVIGTSQNASSYIDTGLSPGETYFYRVRASALGMNSSLSGDVSIQVPSAPVVQPPPNMRVWLRADLGVTIDQFARVAHWADQSGSGNHAIQPSKDERPRRRTDAASGLRTLEFRGDLMLLPDVLTGGSEGEVVFVLKIQDGHEGGALSSFSGLTYPGERPFPGHDPLSITDRFGGGANWHTLFPVQRLTDFHVFNVSRPPDSYAAFINGLEVMSASGETAEFTPRVTTSFQTWHTIGFFALPDELRERRTDIAEIILYDRALNEIERTSLSEYLNTRYNIASAAPSTPSGLVARAVSPTQVSLTWDGVLDGTTEGYALERKDGVSGTFNRLATVTGALNYQDFTVLGGQDYFYRVSKINLLGTSPPSSEAAVSTPASGASFPMADVYLWFRADSGVMLTSAGTVQSWLDAGVDQRNATNMFAAHARPALTEAAIGGRPALTFDGVDDILNLGGASYDQGDVFAVLRASIAGLFRNNGLWNGSSATYYPDQSGRIGNGFGSTTSPWTILNPVPPLNNVNLYNASFGSGTRTVRLNGIQIATESGSTPSMNLISGTIGGVASLRFGGQIAEVICFRRQLTAAERTTVENYLTQKYALGDSDTDGMPDWFELEHFGDLARNGTGDFDGDGINDLAEFLAGLSPVSTNSDGDAMGDGYELANGFIPLKQDGLGDLDGDGVPDGEDAEPNNPSIGRLTILITNPVNGSTLP